MGDVRLLRLEITVVLETNQLTKNANLVANSSVTGTIGEALEGFLSDLYGCRNQIMRVRLAVKAGVPILAMLSAALPVIACARPGAVMTAAEHECCKRMAAQCGRSGMINSHGCCQKQAPPDNFGAVKASSFQLDHSLPDLHAEAVASQATAALQLTLATGITSPPHSPPGFLSSATTVLRI